MEMGCISSLLSVEKNVLQLLLDVIWVSIMQQCKMDCLTYPFNGLCITSSEIWPCFRVDGFLSFWESVLVGGISSHMHEST